MVRLVSRGRPFLRTDARVHIWVANCYLVWGHLLLATVHRVLSTWDVVHVDLVDIRLILRQILLRSRLDAASAILLVEMQWVVGCDVAGSGGPHLILRCIPSLLHVWLGHSLPICTNAIVLATLIGLVTADNHLIVSSDLLLVYATLELIPLSHTTIQLLLLKVDVITATGSVSRKASTTSGLTFAICVCILTASWGLLA